MISSVSVSANQDTGKVGLTEIQNWVAGDSLYIKTDQATLTNPADCSITDRYHMNSSTSDISRSMLLSAYVAGQDVVLTIYGGGCSSNRPQIVAVKFAK